jgi:hypothetical protein
MFPNPQSALSLPPHPSLERYKRLAKQLVKACKSGDGRAIGNWAEQWMRTLRELAGRKSGPEASVEGTLLVGTIEDFARRRLLSREPGGKNCALADAQFVIARSHGFESWPKFVKHLEALARNSSSVSRFEAAADAIVNGDAATLQRLLGEDPKLVRAISTREHSATLLHYVSANGVEGYRQKTPENIVEITEMLLNAGAEIDATAKVYGGGCTPLGLAATSEHPERAGVQEALLQTLLDHGADLEQPSLAGHKQSLVIACVANERPKAAQFLANRGAPLDLAGAAALGQLAIVKSFFPEGDTVKPSPNQEQRNAGFIYACRYGHYLVAEFLLHQGVDLAAQAGDGQTGLHRATIGGHLEIVKLLLRYNPPLEAKNIFGGTVFGQALWSAGHGGDPDVYIAILEALVAAGAKVPERHVPVNPFVDGWMARHGSRAEPSWSWYGEPNGEK